MNDFITKTEKAYLIAVSVLTAFLSITNITVIIITPLLYPPALEIYVFERASLFPFFRLFIIFTPIFIIYGKRFLVPMIFTTVALFPAYFQFIRGYMGLVANFDSVESYNSIRILLMIANPLDYLTFILANLILVWLGTLVIRSFTLNNRVTER